MENSTFEPRYFLGGLPFLVSSDSIIWHHFRLFTQAQNEFVVPAGIDVVGIACFGRGGGCTIPEAPHGKALAGGGGGAFAYGVLAVRPGTVLNRFGVLDSHTYFHKGLRKLSIY
ncbi:MAG: hypothetical protein KZQ65_12115 [Candidatus Thiodiazotropha sp. (ex Gloverina cf. vestifex)]|nr:hypothetical protein [Candidatus Thiodiazotropha sp. (ex Gloverina cf. vestifex)]